MYIHLYKTSQTTERIDGEGEWVVGVQTKLEINTYTRVNYFANVPSILLKVWFYGNNFYLVVVLHILSAICSKFI